jgi:protein CpxP
MNKLNRMKAIVLSSILAIAVAVPIVAAQSTDDGGKGKPGAHWRHQGRRGGNFGGRMFRGIDLTDAQKTQMKQIRENHRQSLQPLMQELRTMRQELRQASESGSFNESLAAQKLAEIAPLQAKLMGEQFKLRQEMMSVLTPEQKTKLQERREEFKSKMSERRARKSEKNK